MNKDFIIQFYVTMLKSLFRVHAITKSIQQISVLQYDVLIKS